MEDKFEQFVRTNYEINKKYTVDFFKEVYNRYDLEEAYRRGLTDGYDEGYWDGREQGEMAR